MSRVTVPRSHLVLCVLVAAGLLSFSTTGHLWALRIQFSGVKNAEAAPAASTFYVDAVNGNDANPGSAQQPWKTLDKAITSISSGDTVLLQTGIYRHSSITFGPAGQPGALTTFRSAPGARPIVTNPSSYPPSVFLQDYVRLDGLWFGGIKDFGQNQCFCPGGSPIGRGKEIINNTIFNLTEGLSGGQDQYYLIQGNRFVNNGNGAYQHGIYIAGGDNGGTGGASQHVIIDSNTLIGGEGWGLHGWHITHDLIYSRNFVTGHFWGGVTDGSDHLIAGNFFWKMKGSSLYPAWGYMPSSSSTVVLNNVFEVDGWLKANSSWVATNLVSNNAFHPGPYPDTSSYNPRGSNLVVTSPGQELAEYGISASEMDNAIQSLLTSFSQAPEVLLSDPTIEPKFTKLKLKLPQTSPLLQKGKDWFGTSPMNIGPDAPVPMTADGFWAAFRRLGLRDWDQMGKLIPFRLTLPALQK